MLDAFAGTKTYKTVKKTLEKQKKEGGPEKMCVLYDMVFGEGKIEGERRGREKGLREGERKGREEGLREGERKGREKEAIANARMFFQNGASLELVSASITTLSRKQLEEIYGEVNRADSSAKW